MFYCFRYILPKRAKKLRIKFFILSIKQNNKLFAEANKSFSYDELKNFLLSIAKRYGNKITRFHVRYYHQF